MEVKKDIRAKNNGELPPKSEPGSILQSFEMMDTCSFDPRMTRVIMEPILKKQEEMKTRRNIK